MVPSSSSTLVSVGKAANARLRRASDALDAVLGSPCLPRRSVRGGPLVLPVMDNETASSCVIRLMMGRSRGEQERHPVEWGFPSGCVEASLQGHEDTYLLPFAVTGRGTGGPGAGSGLGGPSLHLIPFITWCQSGTIWVSLPEWWEVPWGARRPGEDNG